MKILHGTWIPQVEEEFVQKGAFYLWVEIEPPQKRRKSLTENQHTAHLFKRELQTFLMDELTIVPDRYVRIEHRISPQYFVLPSTDTEPLPSIELARYLETAPPEPSQWKAWSIDCYQSDTSIVKRLNDIHFVCLHSDSSVQIGSDLLFWYYYTQFFKQILLKDQYIPALKYREIQTGKGKKKKSSFEIYPTWEIVSHTYDNELQDYIDRMPLACTSGLGTEGDSIAFFDRETLLRHFSECLLNDILNELSIPATF